MNTLFFSIFNLSFFGMLAILAICLARLALKKAPAVFSYCLWVVVLFRLICPYPTDSVN
jgi:hypothetical protein